MPHTNIIMIHFPLHLTVGSKYIPPHCITCPETTHIPYVGTQLH